MLQYHIGCSFNHLPFTVHKIRNKDRPEIWERMYVLTWHEKGPWSYGLKRNRQEQQ